MWTALVEWYKCRSDKNNIEKKMLLGLAHDMLYRRLEEHLKNGYITVDDMENLGYLYEPYRKMGGNGTCERLYEEVAKLSHKKEENRDD